MVVFACSLCGQSVKKNQVESHCFQCRGCESLSCMDCGKVFWGDDYKVHTKCITEDQKYGGKDYQPKPSSNKGEVKQEKWIEHVKTTIATKELSGPLSHILQQMIQHTNIPRKKSKFENFLQNSLNIRNTKLIGQAWEIFAQGTSNESQSSSSRKRHLNDEGNVSNKKPSLNGNAENSIPNFNWTEAMLKILENSESNMPINTLRKMVIAEYRSTVQDSKLTNSELKKKFRHYVSNTDFFTMSKVE